MFTIFIEVRHWTSSVHLEGLGTGSLNDDNVYAYFVIGLPIRCNECSLMSNEVDASLVSIQVKGWRAELRIISTHTFNIWCLIKL